MRLHSFLTGFFAIFQVLLTTGEALKAWNVTGDDFARARWQSSKFYPRMNEWMKGKCSVGDTHNKHGFTNRVKTFF